MSAETREDMQALRGHLKQQRGDARQRQKAVLFRMRDEGTLLVTEHSPYHLRVRRRDMPDVVFDVWPGSPSFRRLGAGQGSYGWDALMRALGCPGVPEP